MPYIETDAVYDGLERCSRCLLPDSFPGIGFDDEGVCNYCHDHLPINELGEDAFAEGQVLKRGKEIIHCDVRVTNAGGKLLAQGTVVYRIIEREGS